MEKTLGGDRLGAGKKQKVHLHNYERSTQDMGYVWRSTMSAGTLVPFLKEVALPGDTFDIDLNCEVLTHPTIGPLFGSYKVQLDIFQAPIRLYNGKLHNNQLGIGLHMDRVKLPILKLRVPDLNGFSDEELLNMDMDNYQCNPSSILSYLGIRGGGTSYGPGVVADDLAREFNGVPFLAYWDIYKNYYANKQEEIGYVVHASVFGTLVQDISTVTINTVIVAEQPAISGQPGIGNNSLIEIATVSMVQPPNEVLIWVLNGSGQLIPYVLGDNATLISTSPTLQKYRWNTGGAWILGQVQYWSYVNQSVLPQSPINLYQFPLADIDTMRTQILEATSSIFPFDINATGLTPYTLIFEENSTRDSRSITYSQEGLGIKTYQSDLFNNWLQTEWIDGAGGINEITSIDTSGGSFGIDTLILAKKVYNMLNRIAVSGGSYDDWLDAVYVHDRITRAETPIYHGGLIKELVFQEVVNTSESTGQVLGTLAGKGRMSGKHKGGKVTIRVDEPSYIMGIVSLTPRIDYSQGNEWDVHLKTMDDLHKPQLDEIGFQELITEQMAWWDTTYDRATGLWIQKSAGKQPAWINYMTNVNKVRGNFAIADNEMFMTLNRRYEPLINTAATTIQLKDLTTYIDPRIYNNIFAQTSLDSQNFWTQIGVDMIVRRKLSAKVMPNL